MTGEHRGYAVSAVAVHLQDAMPHALMGNEGTRAAALSDANREL